MRSTKAPFLQKSSGGFTLVEIMLALLISGIIMVAVITVFISQQRTYLAQEQVVEMQQNIRAALNMMEREIRMAGYNPEGGAGAGITTAEAGQLSFTQDLNEDGDFGDAGEAVDFGFSVADDDDRDGIPDGNKRPAASLGRQIHGPFGAGGYQDIAENIQAIEFFYTMADGTKTLAPVTLADIRSVQISILARAGEEDRDFSNTRTYTTASGTNWGPFNDNFRRRLLITTVQCRNIGL